MNLQELKTKSPADLLAYAEELEIENASTLRKQDMMFAILKQLADNDVPIYGTGVLEVLQDGFGFLRSPEANYLPGPDDIYVSPSQVRRFGLRTGDTVAGEIRAPKDGERYFALLKINEINFDPPEKTRHRINFDNLTPLYPDQKLKLEIEDPTIKDMTPRVIDLTAPQGKGQRGLIVAPPRTGKTMILQNIAHSIAANHPEVYLLVLLIDERPEEVTDMDRSVNGEVVSSTFDEPATRHVAGRRDGDREGEAPGRAQEGRGDPARLHHPPGARLQHRGAELRQGADRRRRRQCAAAPEALLRCRAQHRGGRLPHHHRDGLIDTGSRMDEVIFEEFKGTGNSEIVLDRKLADKRTWPGHGHRQVRHPQGGAPGRQGDPVQDVGAAPHPPAHGRHRLHGVPDRQAEAGQDQRRLLRFDESVGLLCRTGGPALTLRQAQDEGLHCAQYTAFSF